MPRNGRVRAASTTRFAQAAFASRLCACNRASRSGPGSTTRAGAADRLPDPRVTTIAASGATWTSAFATERRLPIP